ncbi:hypothetical protein ABEB36_014343 [Hypothenemus hampei]|uniref:Uncharacterized protein n=1 Tax=Hypothenemus hampei TaxID=57062 RepID=A0ABD1E4F5_HYPHA
MADLGVSPWCDEIQKLGEEFGWSGREMVARVGAVLKREVAAWFSNWEPDTRDWNTFSANLIALFPPKRNLSEKLRKVVEFTSEACNTYCIQGGPMRTRRNPKKTGDGMNLNWSFKGTLVKADLQGVTLAPPPVKDPN